MSDSVIKDATDDASFYSIDLEPPKLLSVVSSCRICLSSMLDPARLVCGHKFCETCLNKYWNATEQPEFVVCPLCRNYAFKVGFVQKNNVSSTRDFRRRFDPNHFEVAVSETNNKNMYSNLCVKISLIMPIVYFLVKFLKPVIMDILLLF